MQNIHIAIRNLCISTNAYYVGCLKKTSGGSDLWIDEDKQEYEVEIPIGVKLLMFDIAGDCPHKCKSG